MDIEKTLFVIFLVGCLLSAVLYVFFGQVTVRKLRKNPNTKELLGMEYISGWDIINVAKVFSLPRKWMLKVEKSKFAFMYANSSALYENTTIFDRVLGCIFYWSLTLSGLFGAFFALLNSLGFFD
ncbi:hypothetical protein [Pseudoalteromonas sp. APC 3355]|uniref:hypothetical protein n=1 Tax=Pseudoalteromonas sp. APC 3355 TaxID=3035199 RepID=UPI0025B319C2|nr:hypothetical protein [Pseudoalteromonas sp. APC 3355]MDN3473253.1 hypothetical protein [Pseudoalteromonas sp. APC 3355]